MPILTREALALASNRDDILDPTVYADDYLADVFAQVQDDIASYLNFDPVLQVHTAEEGPAHLVSSGDYAGRYYLELTHTPLLPGAATGIFTSLQLTYGAPFATPVDVDLTNVLVSHRTGQVFALAPGLAANVVPAALSFAYAPISSPLSVSGYIATYVAGYATGYGDPTAPGGGSYGAPPMPANIRQAAVLLARERLALDKVGAATSTSPSGGALAGVKIGDYEVRYYNPFVTGGPVRSQQPPLGYGTMLAQMAAAKLDQYLKDPLPTLLS